MCNPLPVTLRSVRSSRWEFDVAQAGGGHDHCVVNTVGRNPDESAAVAAAESPTRSSLQGFFSFLNRHFFRFFALICQVCKHAKESGRDCNKASSSQGESSGLETLCRETGRERETDRGSIPDLKPQTHNMTFNVVRALCCSHHTTVLKSDILMRFDRYMTSQQQGVALQDLSPGGVSNESGQTMFRHENTCKK
ncbi:hypothetical protein AOLI_G00199410 [Acnodon oligacanthus]